MRKNKKIFKKNLLIVLSFLIMTSSVMAFDGLTREVEVIDFESSRNGEYSMKPPVIFGNTNEEKVMNKKEVIRYVCPFSIDRKDPVDKDLYQDNILKISSKGICFIPDNFATLSKKHKIAILKEILSSLENRIKILIRKKQAIKNKFFDNTSEIKCVSNFCVQIDNSKAININSMEKKYVYDLIVDIYDEKNILLENEVIKQDDELIDFFEIKMDEMDVMVGKNTIIKIISINKGEKIKITVGNRSINDLNHYEVIESYSKKLSYDFEEFPPSEQRFKFEKVFTEKNNILSQSFFDDTNKDYKATIKDFIYNYDDNSIVKVGYFGQHYDSNELRINLDEFLRSYADNYYNKIEFYLNYYYNKENLFKEINKNINFYLDTRIESEKDALVYRKKIKIALDELREMPSSKEMKKIKLYKEDSGNRVFYKFINKKYEYEWTDYQKFLYRQEMKMPGFVKSAEEILDRQFKKIEESWNLDKNMVYISDIWEYVDTEDYYKDYSQHMDIFFKIDMKDNGKYTKDSKVYAKYKWENRVNNQYYYDTGREYELNVVGVKRGNGKSDVTLLENNGYVKFEVRARDFWIDDIKYVNGEWAYGYNMNIELYVENKKTGKFELMDVANKTFFNNY